MKRSVRTSSRQVFVGPKVGTSTVVRVDVLPAPYPLLRKGCIGNKHLGISSVFFYGPTLGKEDKDITIIVAEKE